jgi:hypothetical protein
MNSENPIEGGSVDNEPVIIGKVGEFKSVTSSV